MDTEGHASKNTDHAEARYKVYPISEKIERGDVVMARRIGDIQDKSEEAPGVEQEPIQARKYATRAQLETMRATQDRERTQREREDDTRQPRQEVITMVNCVGTERGSGGTDTGMAAKAIWRLLSPEMHKAFPHLEVFISK